MMSEQNLRPNNEEESFLVKESRTACSQASSCLSQTQELLSQIEELHTRISCLIGVVDDALNNSNVEKDDIALAFEASNDVEELCDEAFKLTMEFEKALSKAEAFASIAVQSLCDSQAANS